MKLQTISKADADACADGGPLVWRVQLDRARGVLQVLYDGRRQTSDRVREAVAAAVVKVDEVPLDAEESCREAVDGCPVDAISVPI